MRAIISASASSTIAGALIFPIHGYLIGLVMVENARIIASTLRT